MRMASWFGTVVALACAVSPAGARQPVSGQFTHGQVTFVQDGREATWLLWQGTLRQVSDPIPALQAAYLFTPDGKPGPEDGGSLLRLSLTKSRETYTLTALAVEGGPAGGGLASYRDTTAKCKLVVTHFDEKAVGGSISCTGTFEGGPAITKLYFSSAP